MIEINPSDISVDARYKLLTGSIIPRPIGVISTVSAIGIANFAPFSYFNIAGHAPMAVSFAIAGPKPDGSEKDTLRNAKLPDEGGAGEFVAHIATESFATAMAKSAFPLSEDESEFDFTGLTAVESKMIKAPRIKEAPIAFECKTIQVIAIGRSRLIIGEILYMHFAEDILLENYRIDYRALKAIGRMSGSRYCKTTDAFGIKDEKFFPGSRKKAVTASQLKLPSHVLSGVVKQFPELQRSSDHNGEVELLPGGFPVLSNDIVVGGIGVSGGNFDQDKAIGEYAVNGV